MLQLIKTFKDNKIFCGEPDPDDYISNSGLSEIKRVLLNNAPFRGDEIQLLIGGEVHLRSLKDKKSKHIFSKSEETDIQGMCNALSKNPFWKFLMSVCDKEQESTRKVLGVNLKVILDLKGRGEYKHLGADLKTTSCKTLAAFIKTALLKYDYLRQGWLYKQAEQLEEFYFIGVQKHYPYKIFILDVADYAKEEQKIAEETIWLIEFYKQFGRAFNQSTQNSKRTKRRTVTEIRALFKGHGNYSNDRDYSMWEGYQYRRYLQSLDGTEAEQTSSLYRTG